MFLPPPVQEMVAKTDQHACHRGLKMPAHKAIAIALAIAATKGFLVAGFFMHLLSERKVIYEDMRPLPKEPCPSQERPALPPCTYFDRETLATFAPALEKAPKPVLKRLQLASPARAQGAGKCNVQCACRARKLSRR